MRPTLLAAALLTALAPPAAAQEGAAEAVADSAPAAAPDTAPASRRAARKARPRRVVREVRGDEHAAVKVAYRAPRVVTGLTLADLAWPGARVGVEAPLVVGVTNRRTRKGKLRNGVGELFAAGHVGLWVEPRNVVPTLFLGELGTRWTGQTGGHVGLHLVGGLAAMFHGGTTLRVADDGAVSRGELGGRPAFHGHVAFSFGYDVGKKAAGRPGRTAPPLSIGLRQGIGLFAPVSTTWVGAVLTELTFTVRLGARRASAEAP